MVPFHIHVKETILDDLRARLGSTRLATRAPGASWERGTDGTYLRELIGYWQSEYDWRKEEERLNTLSHFKAPVHGADVHFVRAGAGMPLLLLHGWPDSFVRYLRVIPELARDFELVVPSLPGFGFTGPVSMPRDKPTRHSARILFALMTEVLGHRRFAIAGGDGGSVLAQLMALEHPEAVVAIHLTDLGWHAYETEAAGLTHSEKKWLEHGKQRFLADGAYAMVQTTRPRSLAAGLLDSPAGLASWILDRFHSWSVSGDLDQSFGRDLLLTNLMIYWITRTIGSSTMTYFDDRRSPSITPKDRVDRPVGLALFPDEPGGIPPRSFAERTLNVMRWTPMPRGSHFAALEEPALWAADVRGFFHDVAVREETHAPL